MYNFNNQPNNRRNSRRGRGLLVFPWLFFFIFIGAAHGQLEWLFPVIGVFIFIFFLMARSGNLSSWTRNQPPYQQPYYRPTPPSQQQNTSQTPYYQPTTPPEQETAETPYYPSYQQGYQYQPPAEEVLTNEGPYQSAEEPLQEEYDQPKAEYPQQMPPM